MCALCSGYFTVDPMSLLLIPFTTVQRFVCLDFACSFSVLPFSTCSLHFGRRQFDSVHWRLTAWNLPQLIRFSVNLFLFFVWQFPCILCWQFKPVVSLNFRLINTSHSATHESWLDHYRMWLPYCRIRPLGYFGLRLSYESRRRSVSACHSVNTYFSTCKPCIVVWGFWHACMEELSQILNLNFAQLSIGAATFPGSLIWCMFSIRVCLCILFTILCIPEWGSRFAVP